MLNNRETARTSITPDKKSVEEETVDKSKKTSIVAGPFGHGLSHPIFLG